MKRKLSAAIIVIAMVCVSFAAVSLTVPAEAVHGPFELKTGNWPTVPVDIIDQTQQAGSASFPSSGSILLAQTFTPSQTSNCNRVEIFTINPNTFGSLRVSIWDTSASEPLSQISDMQTIDSGEVPTNNWLVVEFAAPAFLNAFTEYAIVVEPFNGFQFEWTISTSNPYPDGMAFNNAGSWIPISGGLADF